MGLRYMQTELLIGSQLEWKPTETTGTNSSRKKCKLIGKLHCRLYCKSQLQSRIGAHSQSQIILKLYLALIDTCP